MSNENNVVLPEHAAVVTFEWRKKPDVKWLMDTVVRGTKLYTEQQVRALLATATGLPAQAVAYIDSEVLTSFLSSSNYRPADGWDCHIRHQENKRDTDVPLYSRPQAQADARDAERYRFIVSKKLILSGGTEQFGWPIAPFGGECDRYIDAAIAAAKGEAQ